MNRRSGWPALRGWLAFVLVGGALAACESGAGEPKDYLEKTLKLEEGASVDSPLPGIIGGEGATARAIMVAWASPAKTSAKAPLVVELSNTSDDAQPVTVILSATAPSGDMLEQQLTEIILASGERRQISIALDDLPLKSSAHPSHLRVIAQYGEARGASENASLKSFTDNLMITFDKSFSKATVRTEREQIVADALSRRHLFAAADLGQVLERRPESGAFAARGTQAGVVLAASGIITELPVPVDHEHAQHYADTEPLKEN